MAIHYVIEKLSAATRALALGPGDMRSRLVTAHLCMHTLRDSDFPNELRKDWRWICEQLSRRGPIVRDDGTVRVGSVENTMQHIQNRTAVKIAERLLELYRAITEATPRE
jgi:hypothetical protein